MFSRAAIQAIGKSRSAMASSVRTTTVAPPRRITLRRALPTVSSLSSSTTTTPSSFFSTAAAPYSAKVVNPEMFCRQCEQTKDHFACTSLGVCGKTPETASIQDALVHVVKSVSSWAMAARAAGATHMELAEANEWTLKATFSTLTNVNFSEMRIQQYIQQGMDIQTHLKGVVEGKGGSAPTEPIASLQLTSDTLHSLDDLELFGKTVSIPTRMAQMNNDDCFSLNEIATYGLKGACAYATHCLQLGHVDDSIMEGIHQSFVQLASDEADMDGLLKLVDNVGAISAKVLGLLDTAHATVFGEPGPSQVCTTAVAGKAILVSGHDLKDLHALLEQTEGTGVNVYTHGEMMPAHAYPELRKYDHLVGNYGTAWQNQKFEFASFPGPVIVTTNCIIEPRRIYKNRIYTMNEAGYDDVKHIGEDRDFTEVIAQAKECKGFERTIQPPQYLTTGFNHRAVLPLADQIIAAAKSGELSRIFLIGGCDGSQWNRNYFTDLAEETPEDSIILTLGCAKNRVIHSDKLLNATLPNGLPRVLDMGQCNDAYSAVVVATELAKALDCSINDLPLSLAVSHLEQKAAAVLLTLLHLGVKNIRLGPSIPAYISPNVLQVLSKNYNLMPTGDYMQDLEAMKNGM